MDTKKRWNVFHIVHSEIVSSNFGGQLDLIGCANVLTYVQQPRILSRWFSTP